MKHGPPAEQNVVSFQLGHVGLNGGRFAGQDFSHLFGAETLAIQKHLQDIIHSVFVADSVAARSKKRKQWRAREKAQLRALCEQRQLVRSNALIMLYLNIAKQERSAIT